MLNLLLPHADGDMPWMCASCVVFVLKLCGAIEGVLHKNTGPSRCTSFANRLWFVSRDARDWNKERKTFAFGKVDLTLKSQIYFKGFAFLQSIVS